MKRQAVLVALCALLLGGVYYAVTLTWRTMANLQNSMEAVDANMDELSRRFVDLEHSYIQMLKGVRAQVAHLGKRIDAMEKRQSGVGPPEIAVDANTAEDQKQRRSTASRFYEPTPYDSSFAEELESNPFTGNGDDIDGYLFYRYKRDVKRANAKVGAVLANAFNTVEATLGQTLTEADKLALKAQTEDLQHGVWEMYKEQAYNRAEVRAALISAGDSEGPSRVAFSPTRESKMIPGRQEYVVSSDDAPPGNSTASIMLPSGMLVVTVSPEEYPAFKTHTPDIVHAEQALFEAILSRVKEQ